MSPIRTYTQSTHKFFNQLVTFLGAFTTWSMGIFAQRTGSVSSFPRTKSVSFSGKAHVSNINLKFYPYNLLKYFVDQSWPEKLEFHDQPIGFPDGDSRPSHTIPNVGKYVNYLIMSTFISYFESNLSELESCFSEDCQKWPDIWNFGRVVRNAFAHGGIIKFDNPNASPVTWSKLTYSPSNNGHVVIQDDISCVEMILLMEDMDKHL